MRTFIVLCFLGLVALTLARPDTKYTNKYDNINLDEILANQRLLVPYLKCILEEGKMQPLRARNLNLTFARLSRRIAPSAQDNQRKGTRKVLAHLINHEEGYWNRLKAKYDPESKYTSKHEQELRELKQ